MIFLGGEGWVRLVSEITAILSRRGIEKLLCGACSSWRNHSFCTLNMQLCDVLVVIAVVFTEAPYFRQNMNSGKSHVFIWLIAAYKYTKVRDVRAAQLFVHS